MLDKTEDLEKLAEECLAAAKTIKQYLASNGEPQMSFDQNGPTAFPRANNEVQLARLNLREASRRLNTLAGGPDEVVTEYIYHVAHDLNAFRYINHFKVTKEVPLNATISYANLAQKLNLDMSQLKQVIRQLIQINVFCEPQPDHVAHTAASKLLLQHGPASYNAWICEDSFRTVSAQVDALKKWGHGSQEPTEAAFNYAFNTDKPMYQYYEDDPGELRERFSSLMTYITNTDDLSNRHVAAGFDWSSLPEGATVVDVAGNAGHCSIPIAQANPTAKIVVQDLPLVVKRAQDPETSVIPAHLRDRFTFMAHDFYSPQPVEADVYFIRMIMHDYSDKYATKIIKALVPAMKPGARLIVMDQVKPPVGTVPGPVERHMRTMDLQMMGLTNAKERDHGEWTSLFHGADPRLKIKNIVDPPGSNMALIEVVLEEEQ